MKFPDFAAPAFALALALGAHAIHAQPVASSPPTAVAPATPAAYVSAFENYRAFRDDPMVSWERANREVGSRGGQMGHMRGSTGMGMMDHGNVDKPAMAPATPTTADKAAQPPNAGHAGHGAMPTPARPQ